MSLCVVLPIRRPAALVVFTSDARGGPPQERASIRKIEQAGKISPTKYGWGDDLSRSRPCAEAIGEPASNRKTVQW